MTRRISRRNFRITLFLGMVTLSALLLLAIELCSATGGLSILAAYLVIGFSPMLVRARYERRSDEMKAAQGWRKQYPSAIVGPVLLAGLLVVETVLNPTWLSLSIGPWLLVAGILFLVFLVFWVGEDMVYPESAMESPSKLWYHAISLGFPGLMPVIGVVSFVWHANYALSWMLGIWAVVTLVALGLFVYSVLVWDRKRDLRAPEGVENVINPAHGCYDWATGESLPLHLIATEGQILWF